MATQVPTGTVDLTMIKVSLVIFWLGTVISLIIVGLILLYFNQAIVRFFKNSKHFLLNVVKCFLLFFATLFIILTINFILLRFLPGDPVLELVPYIYDQVEYEEVYRALGLHLPIIEQYFLYIKLNLRFILKL